MGWQPNGWNSLQKANVLLRRRLIIQIWTSLTAFQHCCRFTYTFYRLEEEIEISVKVAAKAVTDEWKTTQETSSNSNGKFQYVATLRALASGRRTITECVFW
jgi:hypothetical protein